MRCLTRALPRYESGDSQVRCGARPSRAGQMRNTALHRIYPGAAVRYETDAYSTIRPPNEIAGRRSKSSPCSSTRDLVVQTAMPAANDVPICAWLVTCRSSYYRANLQSMPSVPFCFLLCCMCRCPQHRRRNGIKSYSGSWRHSAETRAIARRSKVIAGRFYDFN